MNSWGGVLLGVGLLSRALGTLLVALPLDRRILPPCAWVVRRVQRAGAGLGLGWGSSKDQGCAAARSLGLVVPGTGRKWFVGSADKAEAVRCGSA